MRYNAFISYRHSELDMFIAKKIHKGLETFKVPRTVRKKTGINRIQRVFRDQEELPIGSDLGDNIVGALRESEYLIVICSPRTKESYWVQKEIDTFIRMHGREHILAVLIEGEPEDSFPEALLTDEEGNPVEPLAADVRGSNRSEINRKLKTEVMRLAAPLLHCSYDDLRQRHRERRMRKIAAIASGVAVFAMAFAVYSAYNTAIIQQNYKAKQINQSKYLADTSLQLLEDGDRRAAALVALEALPTEENNRPFVANAQYALSESLYAYELGNAMTLDGLLKHDLPVRDFSFNQDATRMVSYDSGYFVYLWDIETGQQLLKIAPSINEDGYISSVNAIAITAENNIVIADQKGVRALNEQGEELWKVDLNSYSAACKFSNNVEILACDEGEDIIFIDTATGDIIARLENDLENDYSVTMAFNAEGDKFAISHLSGEEEEEGCVSLYDLVSREITHYHTVSTSVSEINITWDSQLVVAGLKYRDIAEYEAGETETGYVEKIDTKTGAKLWQDTYDVKIVDIEAADIVLKSRKYLESENNMEHDEIILTVDNCVYTWDAVTGEKIVSESITNAIRATLISTINHFGYLADSNGKIHIFNLSTGANYTNAAIATGKSIKDMLIRSGIMALRTYESPDITILKYHEGKGKTQVEEFSASILQMDVTEDEAYYVLKMDDAETNGQYLFYNSEDKTCIGELKISEDENVIKEKFVDNSGYAVITAPGKIIFYNFESDKTEELEISGDKLSMEAYVTSDTNLALLYDKKEYYIVDLAAREVRNSGETEEFIYGAILSEDGKKIYANMSESGLTIMEVDGKENRVIGNEQYFIASGSKMEDVAAISRDGKLLAISCIDNVLRIMDTDTMETVVNLPFAGKNHCLLYFSQDGSTITMQGDDYYLKVYSLTEKEFLYISTWQNNRAEEVIQRADTDVIVIKTTAEMVVLSGNDYGKIAEIDNGLAYFPKQKKVYCEDGNMLCEFPFKTLEMLVEEAHEQFGDEKLTEMERIKYHVE